MGFLTLMEKETVFYNEVDAVLYIKAIHKLGKIIKLFKVPIEIYDCAQGGIGATSLKILRCWAG